jgi:hypothetical protein
MATDKEYAELVGRAVLDLDLRRRLLADPLALAQSMGLTLTDEQLAQLKALDLGKLSEGLDDRLSKRRY